MKIYHGCLVPRIDEKMPEEDRLVVRQPHRVIPSSLLLPLSQNDEGG